MRGSRGRLSPTGIRTRKKDEDLPDQIAVTDIFTDETWIKFDSRLHTREGFDRIKVKARDITTGFVGEKSFPAKYKTDSRELFQINKTLKKAQTFIDNATAHSSYWG